MFLMSRAQELIGRELEVAAVDRATSQVSGPRGVLLRGEAGMGKTALWEASIDRVEGAGCVILQSRPAESEVQLSFSVLTDLFRSIEDSIVSQLPEPQRKALSTALLREDSAGANVDWRAVGMAVANVWRSISQTKQISICIDDIQWIDPASDRVIGFALRRLGDSRVLILCTLRTEEGTYPDVLTGLRFDTVIDLRPMSLEQIDALLRANLGLGLSLPWLARINTLSAGNPLFAIELARHAATSSPDARGRSIPLPSTLRDLVARRVGELSGAALQCAQVASATPRPTESLVRAVIGDRATAGLVGAEREGVLRLTPGGIVFSHPLLASAIYADIPPDDWRRIHQALGHASDDEEARVRHLALAATSSSEDLAAQLSSAAAGAFRRGAPDVAGELADLAATLTPTENPFTVGKRRITAAEYHYYAGDNLRARELFQEGRVSLPRGRTRARCLVGLAWFSEFNFEGKIALYREALEEAEEGEVLVSRINLGLALCLLRSQSFASASEYAESALQMAIAAKDRALIAQATAALVLCEGVRGSDRPPHLLREARKMESNCPEISVYDSPVTVLGLYQMWQDDLDAARSTFEGQRSLALERGDENSHAGILIHLTELEVRVGAFAAAVATARKGYDLYMRIGREEGRAGSLYALALAHAHRGESSEAAAAAGEGLALASDNDDLIFFLQNSSVLGLLALSQGDVPAAVQRLRALPGLMSSMDVGHAGVFHVLPDVIEAHALKGELSQATAALELMEDLQDHAGCSWNIGAIYRSKAQIAAAQNRTEAAEWHLREALEFHTEDRFPFERARALLALGNLQRRLKRWGEARRSLSGARDIFSRLPATIWARRASDELARVGGRTSSPVELTSTEAQVAVLAASGWSNREISERLFLSVKTVEATLTRVYRKMHVRSRTELANIPLIAERISSRQ
jgi:DNA-binding CsgD family transcriptional regulator